MEHPIKIGNLIMLKAKNLGFTLIELLVVMAIIGTLLSVVAPRYFTSLQHAKETSLKHDLSIMREAISHFYGDMDRYPESMNELVLRKYLKGIPVDPITESSSTWLIISPDDQAKTGIYNIISGAEGAASDDTPYNTY